MSTDQAQRPEDPVPTEMPVGTMTCGLLLFLLFGGVFLVIAASFNRSHTPGGPDAVKAEKLAEQIEADNQKLSSFGVVDEQKKLYRVPIEEAMKLVIAESPKPKKAGP